MNKIIHDMSFTDYLAAEGVSQSQLKNLAKCPAYYKYMLDNTVETDAMRLGRAVHAYILEPKTFYDNYCIIPKMRKAGKAWDDAVASSSPLEIMFECELEKLIAMRDCLMSDDYCSQLLDDSIFESSIFWHEGDESVSMKCKGRIDGVKKMSGVNILFDLKTTRDCSEKAFGNQFFNLKYYMQAAYYLDGFQASTGEKPGYFVFMAIEKEPPYLYSVFLIHRDSELIEIGRKEYKSLLRKYKSCTDSNDFSAGISARPFMIETMPSWHMPKNLEE